MDLMDKRWGYFMFYNVFEEINLQEAIDNGLNQAFNLICPHIQPYIINAVIASAVICFLAFLVKRSSSFYFQLCGDSRTVANKKAGKLSRNIKNFISLLDAWNSFQTKK